MSIVHLRASKLAFLSVGLLSVWSHSGLAAEPYVGARIGWTHLDSSRTHTTDEAVFSARDGLRTFTPGLELGVIFKQDLALRGYYDSMHADFGSDVNKQSGYSSGVDMLFGYSRGVYLGFGVNHTDIGDQHATGLRGTLGYRHILTPSLSTRFELAYQDGFTQSTELSDAYLGASLQYTFGQRNVTSARPEPQSFSSSQVRIADADGDGVADYLDLCPNTPAGQAVNMYGCSAYQARDGRFELDIQFANNSADMTDIDRSELAMLAEHMRLNPEARMDIEGHTSSTGAGWRNRQLSQERADAVKQLLVDEFGISASRIQARGLADTQPLSLTDPASAVNRRVEVRIY
ncbi:OmpA family protein [Aliidiomarina maris]|uniref:OOP family OmpA-OmpF porin n=1 Tax=Aliidiomarina maris TaxID=531312 RepID=A0A327WP31_9GAMM|nr:OmpA family protein [Aliidiomarina maris]RAJ92948.1 OOP family OmpA-OmpF porin [Aliidiomarina maris]RUO20106.1 hypothetical protein CWE07_12525 [Aliidiomarina maris]